MKVNRYQWFTIEQDISQQTIVKTESITNVGKLNKELNFHRL